MTEFALAFLSSGLGAIAGSIIGMLPGIGPVTSIAVLLPFVMDLPPYISFAFITSVYYGTQYGGSTTAILFKVPGEASSMVTCIDGNQLAQQNKSGSAIAVVAISSFFAGIVTALAIYIISPALALFSTKFTPLETFCLSLFGLYFANIAFSENKILAIFSTNIGLFLSFIGISVVTGEVRFIHNIDYLYDGFGLAIIVAGLLGGPELVKLIVKSSKELAKLNLSITPLTINKDIIAESAPAAVRGTIIGSLIGLIPGCGSAVASYISYYVEKLFTPSLGTGKFQGIASPEAANNAAVQIAFIPLLVFGIPETAVMSLILGLMIQQGIPFGLSLFNNHASFIQILVASMIFGNIFLLILNMPLVKFLSKIYKISLRLIFIITGLSLMLGIFFINRNIVDVTTLLFVTAVGLLLQQANIPTMPAIMGFILGPIIEDRFIKTMIIHDADITVFFTNFVSVNLFFVIIIYYAGKYFLNKVKKPKLIV